MYIPLQPKDAQRGSVLLLTLMMIVLMTFEVALVSLVVLRGLGDEGVLVSQNISARRAADGAITQLENQLYSELRTKDLATVNTLYALGGASQAAYNNQTLQMTNPATGASAASSPAIYTSAWVDTTDTRGNYFHLVGRARTGTVDLLVHRWSWIYNCSGGTLTTIVSNVDSPAEQAAAVNDEGRIFFGQDVASGGTFWTWRSDTGLSVLRSGVANYTGQNATLVSPVDGRMFTALDERIWTWHKDTGLSSLQSGNEIASSGNIVVTESGRLYTGDHFSGNLKTWHESTGISVVTTLGGGIGRTQSMDVSGERVFFTYYDGAATQGFYTWAPGSAVSAIMPISSIDYGGHTTKGGKDGRVFFGRYTNGGYWSWEESAGLTTLLSSGTDNRVGQNLQNNHPSWASVQVDPSNGRVSFAGHGKVLRTWVPGTATPATQIATNVMGFGYGNMPMGPDGRLYFSGVGAPYTDRILTWIPGGSLSVLTGALDTAQTMTMDEDGRAYFCDDHSSTGKVFTWTESGGLITIASGLRSPCSGYTTNNTTGIYFGEDNATGNFYRWTSEDGLITILAGRNGPGYRNAWVNPSTGGVYFGEKSAGANYYYWAPNVCQP